MLLFVPFLLPLGRALFSAVRCACVSSRQLRFVWLCEFGDRVWLMHHPNDRKMFRMQTRTTRRAPSGYTLVQGSSLTFSELRLMTQETRGAPFEKQSSQVKMTQA